jgi:RimJ/RimL family protein N-acetyltransferase
MMPRQSPDITLRPFGRDDFARVISWVGTPEALGEWCASFFAFPLDDAQLTRYLESAGQPPRSTILTAVAPTGEAIGHIELSHVWPHLSSRLSRVLVAPRCRRRGMGTAMVSRALALSFETHRVDRIDLGVSADNAAAIACYNRTGFGHVGTWPDAMAAGPRVIDVYWMTVTRSAWETARASV